MLSPELIYDWNDDHNGAHTRRVEVVDETLRDGLQGGVPRLPSLEERIDLLQRVERLGIREAVIGFPADEVAYEKTLTLARGAAQHGSRLRLGLLGRMVAADLDAIERVREAAKVEVSAWLFLGGSRIRRVAQEWDAERLREMSHQCLERARKLGLPVNFGIEDSTRSEPEVIDGFLEIAVDEKVETVTICDTVGYLTPWGCERIIGHARDWIDQRRAKLQLDFHGHSDRGLGLANPMAAIRAGADRVHATALGIGERSGNSPLDLLLVNMKVENLWQGDISTLGEYCHAVARCCGLSIQDKYPVFGSGAFRTQAGVHAAAIVKAGERGGSDVAAMIYSGIDPRLVGRQIEIEVGPTSGRANIDYILHKKGLHVPREVMSRMLRRIRDEERVLSAPEVCALALEELQNEEGQR